MLPQIQERYIPERMKDIDKDFLEFEEKLTNPKDLELISQLLSRDRDTAVKLPNHYNSILLYLTGLTDEFNFLKGRSDTVGGAPPDIDLDFDPLNRHKIVDAIIDYWGRDNVANVLARGSFKPRSILRAYYRVTERSQEEYAELQEKIPPAKFGKEPTLKEMIDQASDKGIDLLEEYSEVFRDALKIENMTDKFSVHAAGLVISDLPIKETVPTWTTKSSATKEGFARITQFDKDELESLGLLKFDILVVDSLSVLKACCELIKQRHNVDIDIYKIPDDDQETYRLLSSMKMAGIWQMETSGSAAKLLHDIAPQNIGEIADMTALHRPGPMQSGLHNIYVENKRSGRFGDEFPDAVAKLLTSTYGVIIYQEQVMVILSEIAGYTLKQADAIRKAIGKKKKDVLAKLEDEFLTRCGEVKKITATEAKDLWAKILLFSDYGFNAAHAVAYSYLTYITAWFKVHYTVEFFTALMSVKSRVMQPKDWTAKAAQYSIEAKEFGIEILPPSINHSSREFTIVGERIYFGLNGIKGIGETAATLLIESRGDQPFTDIYDFLWRINLSKINLRVFQSLIIAGCFDRIGYRRDELLARSESLYSYIKDTVAYREKLIAVEQRRLEIEALEPTLQRRDLLKKMAKKGPLSDEDQAFLTTHEKTRRPVQLKPTDEPVLIEIPKVRGFPLSLNECLSQAEMIGCFIGLHPVQFIKLERDHLSDAENGVFGFYAGVITSVKEITTKKSKQKMAYLTLDDGTSTAEVVCFPSIWSSVNHIQFGSLVVCSGYIEKEDEEDNSKTSLKVKKISIWETK